MAGCPYSLAPAVYRHLCHSVITTLAQPAVSVSCRGSHILSISTAVEIERFHVKEEMIPLSYVDTVRILNYRHFPFI